MAVISFFFCRLPQPHQLPFLFISFPKCVELCSCSENRPFRSSPLRAGKWSSALLWRIGRNLLLQLNTQRGIWQEDVLTKQESCLIKRFEGADEGISEAEQ